MPLCMQNDMPWLFTFLIVESAYNEINNLDLFKKFKEKLFVGMDHWTFQSRLCTCLVRGHMQLRI
jgi:hypothetical protein